MKDGMFVFDAAVHCQDFTDNQIKPGSDGRRVRVLREQLKGFIDLTARRGPQANAAFSAPPDLDWANAALFENSDTDLAMACSVPLFAHWKAGLGPVELSYELARSNPSRILLPAVSILPIRGSTTRLQRWSARSRNGAPSA